MENLKNKNAIITGSNRGIGRVVVEKFAKEGCNVWACARKQTQEFEDDMKQLANQYGVWIKPVYFDLANEEEIKTGFKQIYSDREAGDIDALVHVAGVVHAELFQRTSMNTVKEVFQSNLFGAMTLTQYVLKKMTRQGKGSIVFVSSIAGIDTNPTNSVYGSSKAALIHFAKILASEVGRLGIRVNSVAPGPTETEMIKTVHDKVGDALLEHCAMERLAQPEEIANTIAFLASDEASFVNGQVLRVDGGSK